MKVFVVVEHYDRGSDEVSVQGLYKSQCEAQNFIARAYTGWMWVDGDVRPAFYADPGDPDQSDYVFVQEVELR